MKQKLANRAFYFAIAGLVAGVYFREFTRWNGFTGKSMLGVLHPHLLVLGMGMMLGLLVFVELFQVDKQKYFGKGLCLYTIGLCGTVVLMFIRGNLQVLGTVLSKGLDYTISGVAGIFHILLAVGLLYLLHALRKAVGEKA